MITKEKIDNFIQILKKEKVKEFIKIKTKKAKNLPLTVSKFGWLPFLEKNSEIPKTEDGKQLFLLAQINCEELPENDIYPKKWILQFWILQDQYFWLDYDNFIANDRKRVIYISDLENWFSESEVKKIYKPFEEKDYYWMFSNSNDEFSLTFEKKNEAISYSDYNFEEMAVEKWNKYFPENEIKEFYDLDFEINIWWEDIEVWEYIYDNLEIDEINHKIWWYPYFTQEDPRWYHKNLQKYDTLLLQIDSQFNEKTKNWEIIWWDAWVANFFISKENLEKLDFSEVLYSRDCA